MTLFGWDLSHWDFDRGPVDLQAARTDGITFVSGRLGRPKNGTDPKFATYAEAALAAAFPFVGAYWVLGPGDPQEQADHVVDLADFLAPWWRQHPGWFWQADAERWSDEADFRPDPESVRLFCDRLQGNTRRRVLVYAPRWAYGDELAGIDHPLWASHYGSNPVLPYRKAYPGDGSSRWGAYSGQVPAVLQFGSRTTIGGRGPADANAFRGTEADFAALLRVGGAVPTLAQLRAEPAFNMEYTPDTIVTLCARLAAYFGVPRVNIGAKGNEKHLRGYHRSARWIRDSKYCTSRTYSVSETSGNRNPGDMNWLCAVDATIPRGPLLAACQRLDAAVRAGRLEKITEWYGNTDGDSRVDGYNNIANRVASSDSSHLWHLHMSFDRGRAGEDHTDLFEILTGESREPMPFIGKDASTGEYYVCDLTRSRPIAPDALPHVVYLAKQLGFGHGPVGAEWTDGGWARLGWSEEVFGRLDTGDAAPTQEQVTEAVRAALADPTVVTSLAEALGPLLTVGGATPDQVRQIVDEQLDQAFSKADPRGVDSPE